MEIFKTYYRRDSGDEPATIYWGASNTEAEADRKLLKSHEPELIIDTQIVNIPTGKHSLVAWLNANVMG